MSGFASMFSDRYGKGGAADNAGGISSPGSMGGFSSGYGGAIVDGLSSMFAARQARKAADKQNKLTKEMAAQNRKYSVEDQDFVRKTDLDDRKSRQGLLNPYAAYKA